MDLLILTIICDQEIEVSGLLLKNGGRNLHCLGLSYSIRLYGTDLHKMDANSGCVICIQAKTSNLVPTKAQMLHQLEIFQMDASCNSLVLSQ